MEKSPEQFKSKEEAGMESKERLVQKVLVIDDKSEELENAKTQLGDLGIKYETATNLKEGLQKLKEGEYDYILTDLFYPTGLDKKKDEQLAKVIGDLYMDGYTMQDYGTKYVEKFRPYTESLHRGEFKPDEFPSGMIMAELMIRKGIRRSTIGQASPFVRIVTSEHHHGDKVEGAYVTDTNVIGCFPLLDEIQEGKKNWSEAIDSGGSDKMAKITKEKWGEIEKQRNRRKEEAEEEKYEGIKKFYETNFEKYFKE